MLTGMGGSWGSLQLAIWYRIGIWLWLCMGLSSVLQEAVLFRVVKGGSQRQKRKAWTVENRQYHPTLGVQTFKKKETDASTGKSRIRIRLRLFSEPVQLF